MNIYVGNLNVATSELQLKNLFAPFGEIKALKIVLNHHSGKSKGFAFVEMTERSAGEEAIVKLNNFLLDEKHITVNESANSFRLNPKSQL